MSRVLCLDVGEKRTGVALTDPSRTIATGLTTIEHRQPDELVHAIRPLTEQYDIVLIVVGLPVSLSGNPTVRSESIRRLARRIERKLRIPVELFEEDLSTVRAHQVLRTADARAARRVQPATTGRARRHKQAVDRIAAAIILQDWLAAQQR